MERLKMMKESLMAAAQGQMGNLSQVDTKELGEVIDMIKDLSEAVYYCTITEAMEKKDEDNTSTPPTTLYYREYPYYYNGRPNSNSTEYTEREYPRVDNRDYREGRSPISRRMYMESKEHNNKDTSKHVKELEEYAQELSNDIIEMVRGASSEERQLLQKKLVELSNKVQNAN